MNDLISNHGRAQRARVSIAAGRAQAPTTGELAAETINAYANQVGADPAGPNALSGPHAEALVIGFLADVLHLCDAERVNSWDLYLIQGPGSEWRACTSDGPIPSVVIYQLRRWVTARNSNDWPKVWDNARSVYASEIREEVRNREHAEQRRPVVDRLRVRWTTTEQHCATMPTAEVMTGAEIDPDKVAEWISENESGDTYECVAHAPEILAITPVAADNE